MSKFPREAGILLPIFSLPSDYGIGTLGKEAYNFVDFLKRSKQTYWQILPIGPTSYGDSPYQSFSSFAGNPYFIDLDILKEEGLISEETLVPYRFVSNKRVDYGFIYNTRYTLLKEAYDNFDKSKLIDFLKENDYWLNDYACFMTLKNHFDGVSFTSFPEEYIRRDKKALDNFIKEHNEEYMFQVFMQYEFYKQWNNLRVYANKNGIKLIGDMPIYASLDSCDVWCNKESFKIDEAYVPSFVAGCPPDAISPEGQVWGNPLYDWDYLKENNYEFWMNRLKHAMKLFDIVRIDHFRAFEAYYCIPYGDKTAENGHWEKGPNVEFFKSVKKQIKSLDIIVENLGHITDEVNIMLDKLKYPGMKVLEFGFSKDSLPLDATYNLTENNVIYPTTHDNPPILEWFDELDDSMKSYVRDYLYLPDDSQVCNVILRRVLDSPCRIAILPMWDILQCKIEGRVNKPSTLGNNWMYRISKGDMNIDLSNYLAYLMYLYKR